MEQFGRLDFLICNACAPPLSCGFSAQALDRMQRYITANSALNNVPLTTFHDVLERSSGVLIAVSSAILAQTSRAWPHYSSVKRMLEEAVHAAAEVRQDIAYMVVGPPAMLTDMSNTPGRAAVALAPEAVACTVVNDLARGLPPGQVTLLSEFQQASQPPLGPEVGVTIAASFTTDPLLAPLEAWGDRLGWRLAVQLQPYNQLFQAVLDPARQSVGGAVGAHVLILRLEDWLRDRPERMRVEAVAFLQQAVQEFSAALQAYAQRSARPILLLLCPASAAYTNDESWSTLFAGLEQQLRALAQTVPDLDVLEVRTWHDHYRIEDSINDPLRDELAHIPYTPAYYDLLATLIVRYVYALQTKPCKVLVVDCDNTLWAGVCGEIGAAEVVIDGPYRLLQQFLLEQQQQGMLICLCSKNHEDDVWEVFQTQIDMPLQRADIVAHRINWQPKSDNLKALSQTLNLDLDSFIFIDDSPLECVEVRAHCPEVLTLEWPATVPEARQLLEHIWAFDHYRVSAEDRDRSALYKANIEREQMRTASADFESFIASLALEVAIEPAQQEDFARIAQLSQRVNQFNFTTHRFTAVEIRKFVTEPTVLCQTVRVQDRFGDYGLVGAMIARSAESALELESCWLSCRALGRGVEHAMLARLARDAQQRGLDELVIDFQPSPKNQPARQFLEQLGMAAAAVNDTDVRRWRVPTTVALQFCYRPAAPAPDDAVAAPEIRPAHASLNGRQREALLLRIALELSNIGSVPEPAQQGGVQQGAADYGALRQRLLLDLAAQFTAALSLQPQDLDPDAELEHYITDSLQRVDLTAALKQDFPTLPATFLYEHRSLGCIADTLMANYGDALVQKYALPAPPACVAPQVASQPLAASALEPQALPSAGGVDDTAIAIIGINGRYPQAMCVQDFWHNLVEGKSCIDDVPAQRWPADAFYDPAGSAAKSYCKRGGFITDIDRFDATFFRISPKEAELTDPQQRLMLEITWGLLEDAAYTRASISRNTGVFIGCNANDYALYANDLALQGASAYRNADYYQIPNRISYFFDFHGPSICVDTACSASATALYLACQSLRAGQCQTAIAGGINLFLHPSRFVQYAQMHMLSPSGRCSPFGAAADGTVFGEGVGTLLLKPLSAAQHDGDHIYGVIKGCAINSGGKTNGFTVPNPRAQAALIAEALADAAVDPRTISYVEAHGTGTPLGDPIEIRGLTMAFEQRQRSDDKATQYCAIGSIKANIGHLEAGAAIPGVIKILLQMKHGTLVPSLNAAQTNAQIAFDTSPFYLQQRTGVWQRPVLQQAGRSVSYPRRAGISSFGAGGSNAHFILEEYCPESANDAEKKQENDEKRPPAQIIVLSAKTLTALNASVARLVNELRWYLHATATARPALADIAYTLQCGREAMEQRLALVVDSIPELCRQLDGWLEQGQHESGTASQPESAIYSGNASAGKAYAERLLEGQEGAAYLEQLLVNRRLAKLAELWVMGVTIDWGVLDRVGGLAARPQRVSLPGYPFEGERFWLPGEPSHALANRHRGVLHPLLDAIDPQQSLGHGMVLRKRLSGDEPIVCEHRVYGQTVLPAAGHLGMVQAALAQLGLHSPLRLSGLAWVRPLVIEDASLDVVLRLRAETQQLVFEISGGGADTAPLYAQGAVVLSGDGDTASGATSAAEALAQRQARCQQQLDKAAVYERFRAIGMDFGTYFQVIEQLSYNATEAISQISMAAPYDGEATQYLLHPSLLDGVLQTALSLIPAGAAAALPFALEHIDLLRAPDHGPLYVYVKCLDQGLRFEAEIHDRSGVVCARLHDLVLRQATDPMAEYFYQPRWRAMPAAPSHDGTVPAQVLVIASPESRFIAQTLIGQYDTDTVHQIEWDAATDSQLPEEVERIYFLAGIFTEPADAADLAVLEQREKVGVLALLRWLKAWQRCGYGERELQLRIVTNNVYVVDHDHDPEPTHSNPYAAAIIGLAKVIAKEYQRWQVDCVDLALSADTEGLVPAQLQALLQLPTRDSDLIALRGKYRYRRVLEPARLTPVTKQLSFKTGAVYLILGGAGGLGFEFSRYLARTAQARLVWLGRSEAGPAQQDKIAQIEALGGHALYLQADASDPSSMRRAIDQAHRVFGPIQGAVHSALALNDKTLANMDEQQLLAALAPKTRGSVVLYHALRDEPLDFLLFFSSINAFNTPMGQSNYVAACCFKDAFARHLDSLSPYPVKVINWGFWGRVGVAARADYGQALQGHKPLQPAEGIEAIRRVMAQDQSQMIALKAGAEALAALGVMAPDTGRPDGAASEPSPIELATRDEVANSHVMQPTSVALTDTPTPVDPPNVVSELADRRLESEQAVMYVKSVIAAAIKIQPDAIDGQATFDHYGLDSLLALDISQRIERDLGRMPATLLFEHNTVDDLAAFLLAEHRSALLAVTTQSTPAAAPSSAGIPLPPDAAAPSVPKPAPESVALTTGPPTNEPTNCAQRTSAAAVQDIAVIGIAGRYPQSADLAALWANLVNGQNCIQSIPPERWSADEHYDPDPAIADKSCSKWGGFIDDIDKFDALFFNIAPKDAAYMDPQERLFLETVWAALEDAGYTRQALAAVQQRSGQGIGVFVGCMYQQYNVAVDNPKASAMLSTSSYWYIANRVSHFFNFSGPSIAIDTACSASLSALHLACQSIRAGECAMAIAGGVNLNLHPAKYLRLDQLGMLGSGPVSKSLGDGDGLVPGEGVGAVVLKPLALAVQDGDIINGVIKGSAINHGGRTSGFMVPSPNAQAALITSVLERSGIDPRTIGYIEVAANGSALGDPIELAGLNKAFRRYTEDQHFCAIGSVKSNLGHLEAASGVAQLSKVLLQFKHKKRVPSLNAKPLNPHLELQGTPFYLQQELRPWIASGPTPRRAAISSFGAGGAYAHVLVEDFESDPGGRPADGEPQIVVLSARNSNRLKAYVDRLLAFLNTSSDRSAVLQGQIQALLLERTAELLQVPASSLDADQPLVDYGIDCVQRAALSTCINDYYALDVAPSVLFETPTLAALAEYLYTQYGPEIERHNKALNIQTGDAALVTGTSLMDIAFTLQTGRESMAERLALVVSNRDQLVRGLRAYHQHSVADVPIFQGNVSATQQQLGLLAEEPEGREFIATLIAKRRHQKLAQLWVAGVELDWNLLYTDCAPARKPRRVSLPTYPFARVRHWIDPAEKDNLAQRPAVQTTSLPTKPALVSERAFSDASEGAPALCDRDAVQQAITQVLLGLISELQMIDTQELDANEDLRAYGFDSIGVVMLAQRLSDYYRLDITPERFFADASIAACAKSLHDDHAEALTRFHTEHPAQLRAPLVDGGVQRPHAQTQRETGSVEVAAVEGDAAAIIGVAGMMPQSNSLEDYWSHLIAGDELITEIPKDRWLWSDYFGDPGGDGNKTQVKWGSFLNDIAGFESLFFGISPREAELMDPRQRLFLETVWNTIENAGYAPEELAGSATGLYVGIGNNDYDALLRQANADLTAYCSTGLMVNSVLANRVSHWLDLHGPSEIIDMACSGSTVALHRAVRALKLGECDLAIAGGVNILLDPRGFIMLDKAGILSADGKVRLFDENATGYVRGEGVGAVLLKPYQRALADHDHIYGLIRGGAVNHNGRNYSLTAPNPSAQASVVRQAYLDACVDPATVSYIEAQGTGSALGDPVEVSAFKKAFAELNTHWYHNAEPASCTIGYLKPNIGHLECASGIAGLIKILLAMRAEKLPQVKNVCWQTAGACLRNSPFALAAANQDWPPPCDQKSHRSPRRAGLHSFGFGGVNAHIVVEEHMA